MKVAFISTHFQRSGAAKSCRRMAAALRQFEGVDVDVVSRRTYGTHDHAFEFGTGWRKPASWFTGKLEALLFRWFESSIDARYHFSLDFLGFDISRHPQVLAADVIHLHWINGGFLSLHSLKKLQALGKPVVWSLHDMWPFTGGCHYSGKCSNYETACGQCAFLNKPGPADIAFKSWQKKKSLYQNLNWNFVATSKWLEGLAGKSTTLQGQKISSIATPVDTNLFTPKDKIKARKQLNLPQDKQLILFVAQELTEKRKGFAFLEHALWHLKETRPECLDQYEIVTMGNISSPILEKLSFKQHHLGYLEAESDVVAAYNASNIYIMTSLEDNLPNTVLEAAACGLPVVAFGTGAIPEVVQHQRSGYIAKDFDVIDLAYGIEWALNNNCKQLGEQARNLILEKYSFPVIAQQYKFLYNCALKKKNV